MTISIPAGGTGSGCHFRKTEPECLTETHRVALEVSAPSWGRHTCLLVQAGLRLCRCLDTLPGTAEEGLKSLESSACATVAACKDLGFLPPLNSHYFGLPLDRAVWGLDFHLFCSHCRNLSITFQIFLCPELGKLGLFGKVWERKQQAQLSVALQHLCLLEVGGLVWFYKRTASKNGPALEDSMHLHAVCEAHRVCLPWAKSLIGKNYCAANGIPLQGLAGGICSLQSPDGMFDVSVPSTRQRGGETQDELSSQITVSCRCWLARLAQCSAVNLRVL